MDLMPDFLLMLWLGKPLWLWLGFLALIVALLALDLGLLHRKSAEINVKQSLVMCGLYTALGLAFAGVVYLIYLRTAPAEGFDPRLAIDDASVRAALAAQLYLTGYLIEMTLSMDNVFVMSLIFAFFAVPRKYQHRVLFWGILGAVCFRAIMIGLGAALVAEFHWVLYIFGGFLVITGVKMLFAAEDDAPDIANNPLLKFLRRHMPITHDLHGEHFFVRQRDPKTNRMILYATPLFLALILIECADIVFAVDSVPAIFAITQDPYIVYTSNIFAIIGLRSLYFTLAAMVHRFHYLKYALAVVLIMVGLKIFYAELTGEKVPAWLGLGGTLGILAAGVVYSLYKTRKDGQAA